MSLDYASASLANMGGMLAHADGTLAIMLVTNTVGKQPAAENG